MPQKSTWCFKYRRFPKNVAYKSREIRRDSSNFSSFHFSLPAALWAWVSLIFSIISGYAKKLSNNEKLESMTMRVEKQDRISRILKEILKHYRFWLWTIVNFKPMVQVVMPQMKLTYEPIQTYMSLTDSFCLTEYLLTN